MKIDLYEFLMMASVVGLAVVAYRQSQLIKQMTQGKTQSVEQRDQQAQPWGFGDITAGAVFP